MLKLTLVIAIGFAVLTGCAIPIRSSVVNSISPSPLSIISQHTLTLNRVEQVRLSGNLHIVINGHRPENTLSVLASPEQLRNLHVQNKQGILTVSNSAYPLQLTSRVPLTIELNLAYPLYEIDARGNVNLNTKNIGDQALVLNLRDYVSAKMTGNIIVLQRVNITNRAILRAYWVDSTDLTLRLRDQAKVFLGGIVSHINIKAKQQSQLHGRYLRVKQGFVKTSDYANVSVQVKHALSTLSTGNSTVYYYRDPNFGDYYLSDSGSALRMIGIA